MPLSSLCIGSTFRLPFANWMNLPSCKLRPSCLLHLNWGAGFPKALQCIMPGPPLMSACCGASRTNLAKEVTWIKTTIICVEIAVFLQWPRENFCFFAQRSVLRCHAYVLSSRFYVVVCMRTLLNSERVFFSQVIRFSRLTNYFFFDLLWFSLIFSILN